MTVSKHTAVSAESTLASTQLNSLATATTASAGTAYDNSGSSERYLFCDITLDIATQGSARSAGSTVEVYMEVSYDAGSTYTAADSTYAKPVAIFPLDAATTARRVVVTDVPVPPALCRFKVRNITGQAFAASGSSLFGRFHSIDIV